ncbi:MAG: glucose-6-phosphate dehydrogenase assembly protein OpcA [Simkania negevensis]|nr:glucose-6-phosphate dehydrogenase assembly protein OpcA [Simkania negevensis]
MTQIIHPSKIESQLERIWDSLQGTNKMRACLFNLLIVAKKCKRSGYLNTIAQKVIERFPSRVIFISYGEELPNDTLETRVSVLTAGQGESEIVCDLIEIEVGTLQLSRVPFIVLPHILPDLPLYLVHADDPSAVSPITPYLEEYAKRIIFDSESTNDLPSFAKAVLKHKEKKIADVADLNWARIEGWRQLFASVFKPDEELSLLRKAHTFHIRYNAKETDFLIHTHTQAIYLQGWIACQLNWKLETISKEKDLLSFIYKTAHSPSNVFLQADQTEKLPPGRILSIEIETDKEYRFSFQRNLKYPHHVSIEKSSPKFCSLPSYFVLEKDVSGQSLVKEICHKGSSKHYLNLLTMLSKLEKSCLC